MRHDVSSGATCPVVEVPELPLWSGGPKRVADIVGAAALLLLAAPVMVLIALLVGVAEGRPVLIGHSRIGHGGASFRCLKWFVAVWCG